MLKKIREFFQKKDSEKGQGVVEYALIIGFVAVLAVALIGNSGLKDKTKDNVDNAKTVLDTTDYQFEQAVGSGENVNLTTRPTG